MKSTDENLGIAIHIEPASPVELPRLIANLKSIENEYEKYSKDIFGAKSRDLNNLNVSSISPGSIDILLRPEILDVGVALTASFGPFDAAQYVFEFAQRIKTLIDTFSSQPDPETVSLNDCNNAINIVGNVVEAGGTQTISTVNVAGDLNLTLEITEDKAKKVLHNASRTKALLKLPSGETFNSQALQWKTFDKGPAKTEGQRSPDKGIIQELDPKPKPIFFEDGEEGLKSYIINSDENPYQMIYYVDVEVVTVDEKIKAYRIVRFRGTDPLN